MKETREKEKEAKEGVKRAGGGAYRHFEKSGSEEEGEHVREARVLCT